MFAPSGRRREERQDSTRPRPPPRQRGGRNRAALTPRRGGINNPRGPAYAWSPGRMIQRLVRPVRSSGSKHRLLLGVERFSRSHYGSSSCWRCWRWSAAPGSARSCKLESNILALIPEGNRQVDTLKEALEDFGSIDYLLVLLEAGEDAGAGRAGGLRRPVRRATRGTRGSGRVRRVPLRAGRRLPRAVLRERAAVPAARSPGRAGSQADRRGDPRAHRSRSGCDLASPTGVVHAGSDRQRPAGADAAVPQPPRRQPRRPEDRPLRRLLPVPGRPRR